MKFCMILSIAMLLSAEACGWTVSGAQKADLEDILTHVQGETPETARLLANSMAEEERTRILTYYENMKGKLVFTPWQVAAAESLRDGDAASAIAAHHLRGRFHIGYDEEKTLTDLVDDWDRYQRENPTNPAWYWRARGLK